MGSLWNAYYLYNGYAEDNFKAEIDALWTTVKPLYEQLYTYVRRILSENVYPDELQRFGRLPAHVLGIKFAYRTIISDTKNILSGNMWAQSWGNIAPHVLPYDADPIDATPAMIEQVLSLNLCL